MKANITTLQELQSLFPSSQNVNDIHRKRLTPIEKLALSITQHVGTMGFFFIILCWTILWLSWNMFSPKQFRFDPYPAFVLWLFISNLIQIHLMPLIMIGQNLQGEHANIRAEHDYATDQKAEKEIETIILHLEHQQKLIHEVLKKVEQLEHKKL